MTAPAFPLFTVQKRHGSEERIKLSGGQITAMAEEIWADNLFITHLKELWLLFFFCFTDTFNANNSKKGQKVNKLIELGNRTVFAIPLLKCLRVLKKAVTNKQRLAGH